MKVLMIGQHVNFFRNLDTVMRELCRRGHEVVFLHGTRLDDARVREKIAQDSTKKRLLGRGLQVAQSEIAGVTSGYRPEPGEPWPRRLRVGRQVVNRGIYLRKDHPSPERVVAGLEKDCLTISREADSPAAVAARPRHASGAWASGGGSRPPAPRVRRFSSVLSEIDPDVMLVSPTIWPKDPVEADYLHAARTLGIPTIGYVNSWDNLTSKGTVHVVPDLSPSCGTSRSRRKPRRFTTSRAETIRITGAPHLDPFFAMQPRRTRQQLCAEMGCPDAAVHGVSVQLANDLGQRDSMVTAMADALAQEFSGRAPTLVVRPHPTNPRPFESFSYPSVVVHPREGDQADSPESWQEYYDQLAGALCVFGLNTTAFLEAVVANRPCLTIVSEKYWPAQGRTGHFRHLLKGDFLEVCRDCCRRGRARAAHRGRRRREGRRPSRVHALVRSPVRARGAGQPRRGRCDRDARASARGSRTDLRRRPAAGRARADACLRGHWPMSASPFFTIAIPTKNRVDQLRSALRSVLEQTFEDLEVIVCDNGDEAVCACGISCCGRGTEIRVSRYVRTSGKLSMPDNWERAIADARGEYVGILTDRSVFRPDALSLVYAEIERSDTPVVSWFPDQYGRDPLGTMFKRRRCSGERREFDSAEVLEYFAQGHPDFGGKLLPKLMTGVCRRSVIDRVRSGPLGRFCPPVCPDYTSGYLMLAHTDRDGDPRRLAVCQLRRGQRFRIPASRPAGRPVPARPRHVVERPRGSHADRRVLHSPARVERSRCASEKCCPSRLRACALNRPRYYVACLLDYFRASKAGVDLSEDYDSLIDGLNREVGRGAAVGAVASDLSRCALGDAA